MNRDTACINLGQHVSGMWKQRGAGMSQADLATNAIEEPAAELLLQRRDSFADGGLGQKQRLCGPGERLVFGHGQECPEVVDAHVF